VIIVTSLTARLLAVASIVSPYRRLTVMPGHLSHNRNADGRAGHFSAG
jgi:hypothetical protein